MAFTFTNYQPSTPEQQSPFGNLLSNALQKYSEMTKAQYLQPSLAERLKKAQLYNKWYEPNIKSEIGLRGAQAGHLGAETNTLNISNPFLKQKLLQQQQERQFGLDNPLFNKTGTSGDLGRLLYLQHMVKNNPQLAAQLNSQQQDGNQDRSYVPSIDPNNNQNNTMPSTEEQPNQHNFDLNQLVQDAFTKVAHGGKGTSFAPSNTVKDLSALRDAEAGFVPGTDRAQKFDTKEQQDYYINALREKTTGLPKNQHYVYDDKGNKEGISRPYTAAEQKVEVGRNFFDEVFPKINNGLSEFMGKDSTNKFIKYANAYGKDPIATKKIDALLDAERLLSSGVVNEAATLGAGKTNQTFNHLKQGLAQSDIPQLLEKFQKSFVLPSDAFLKSGVRFNNTLDSATKIASKKVPARKTEYYEPEKHLTNKKEKTTLPKETYDDNERVKVETPQGIKVMTYAEAKKLGAK